MDRLRLADELLAALESAGVDYIHWKSNEHLDASLRGATDLDLLVPADQVESFRKVTKSLRFVDMGAPWERRVPGVVARLGFDADTGSLLHLDVTESLTVGERLLKNHRLPVEDWLMEDPVGLFGVPTPTPEKEMTVLYVRSLLKTGRRQLVRSLIRGDSPLPPRIRKELTWLAERVEPNRLADAVTKSGLPLTPAELAEFNERVLGERLDLAYIRMCRSSVRRRFRAYERLPRLRAVPKRWWLRLRTSRMLGAVGIGLGARTLTAPGPLVAVVGADGSGKSRLTRDLESWLGSKLAVRHVYFGQPKTGFWFKLLNKPGSMARERPGSRTLLGAVARFTDPLKWMLLARRRRRMAAQARKLGANGSVVIAERFPLPEFQSMQAPMDGPRLQGDADSPALWARYEQRQYDAVGHADLLVVLDTDLDTLRARKLDLGVEEHRAKVEAVSGLNPGPGRLVLDAGQPYEQVLLQAKTATWETISAAH